MDKIWKWIKDYFDMLLNCTCPEDVPVKNAPWCDYCKKKRGKIND